MVRAFLITAVLLTACKKSKPDCDGAGKAIETSVGGTVGPAAGANITLRCKQDGWSAAATDCVKNAKDGKFRACESKLSKDQVAKLEATTAAIEGAAPAGGSATPPPTPAGPPPDCAGVEATMTKFWSDRVANAKDDAERKAAEAMRVTARARIGKHCNEDKWSAEAADCFKAVTDGGFASCESKLTPMQVESLKKSAGAIQPTP